MPRIPELTAETAPAPVRATMEAQEKAFGFAFNTTKIMGYCPGIAKAHTELGRAIEEAGNIEGRLRYLLYSKVASMNGCPF